MLTVYDFIFRLYKHDTIFLCSLKILALHDFLYRASFWHV